MKMSDLTGDNRMDDEYISRKDVLQALEIVFQKYRMAWGKNYGGFGAAVQETIEELPVAFNKEKVLIELQKHADIASENEYAYGSEVAYGEWMAYKRAADLVEKGGIE